MRELFEVLFSIGVTTIAIVGYALVLARKEDRELRGEAKPRRKRPLIPIAVDPDAHLGRVGTE